MSKDLASQIVVEAARLHNTEQKRRAVENAAKEKERAESSSALLRLESYNSGPHGFCDAFTEQWKVQKDLKNTAHVILNAGAKMYEVTYSPAIATYIAQNYKSRRSVYTRENPELVYGSEDVDVSINFDRRGVVKLDVETTIEQLASSIDALMQVYLSGDLQQS